MASKKTKAELVAENDALRGKIAELETKDSHRSDVIPAQGISTPFIVNEVALEPTGLLLEKILFGTEEAIVSVDESQKIVIFNKGAERIFGFKEKEAMGQPLDVLLPEGTRQAHRQLLELFADGSVDSRQMFERGEIRGRRKNGELFTAEASISKVIVDGRYIFTAFLRDITERKQAEEELRIAHRVLEAVFNAVPNYLWVKSRDGRYLKTNTAGAESFNLIPEQFEGLLNEDIKFISPEDRIKFSDSDRKVFETGKPVDVSEQEITMPNGEIRLRHVLKIPLTDENGNVTGLIGVAEDITERKQAEAALQDSEAKYRELVNSSQDLIWQLDAEGRFTYLNPAWKATLGYEPEEMLGRPFTDFKKPKEASRTIKIFKENLQSGKVYDSETIYSSKSGSDITLSSKSSPIRDSSGNIVGLHCTAQDITERKRMEDALRESEIFLNRAQNVAKIGSWRRDLITNKVIWSNEMFRQYGYEPGAVDPDFNLVLNAMHTEDIDRVKKNAEDALHTGILEPIEYRVKLEHGGYRILRGEGEIERDAHGNPTYLTGTVHDITERKNLEEQLRQSQKMEALGTMAGGIAHDFNNILMPIIGYSQLLMDNSESTSEDRSFASAIFQNGNRAKELVSQILLFSRHEILKRKLTDLRPLIEEVAKFTGSILPKTISIESDVPSGQISVFCDSSQIYQVIVNLCINAGQAIQGAGKIKLSLDSKVLDGFKCIIGKTLSGSYARIAVTDDGMGMNEETRSNIFDPFFTTKSVGKGTGLGLATVFGIVQSHDGGIAVSTELGQGSTFEIFLPIADGRAEQPAAVAGRMRKQAVENILYVDDEAAITELGKAALERIGYNVTGASDGQKALEIFAANPNHYDLVITDQTMPNMTGENLAHELLIIRPEIPIILCTGHSESISAESSKAIGISRFLYKPIAPDELGRVVRAVLDQAKVGSPLN